MDGEIINIENALRSIVQKCESYLTTVWLMGTVGREVRFNLWSDYTATQA